MKKLSIIIPAHNEAKNVPLIHEAVSHSMRAIPTYTYEIIFVDDGSTDTTAQVIAALAERDPGVHLIEFSRNFGKEIATTAGLHAASGDAALLMDADMQHPPTLIPEFVSRWERGAEVVIGVRSKNTDEGLVKRWGSRVFHLIMNAIAETGQLPGETDFRLLDRQVIDAFRALPERGRMTRTLINWLGFRREYLEFVAPARAHGTASYSTSKLIRLALHSVAANSLLPLRIAGYMGLVITLGSGSLGLIVLVNRFIFGDVLGWHITGTAELAIVSLFLNGIVLMCLGLIALYIESIHREVLGRPLYIVRANKSGSISTNNPHAV